MENEEQKYSKCDGWKTSACCGASLIYGYMCADCGEWSESQCVGCEDIDTCEEIENRDND
jgi:hypothetical protein